MDADAALSALIDLPTFFCSLARVTGLFLIAPVLSTKNAPVQARAFFAVALTVILLPMLSATSPARSTDLWQTAIAIGREGLLGASLGAGVAMMLAGLQMAGQIVAQMAGAQMAGVYDQDSATEVAIHGKFFDLVAVAAWLCGGGHRSLIGAVIASFRVVPPGEAWIGESIVATLAGLMGQSLSLGLRAAAPIAVALFLATTLQGIVSRTLPQLDILSIGLNLNAILLLIMITVAIGVVVMLFTTHADTAVNLLEDAILLEPTPPASPSAGVLGPPD